MNQYPVLLHSHSSHSDGQFSPEELIQHALDFGYKGLILTDHNTTAGCEEIVQKQLDQEIVFLPGMEWTSNYGHMLIHDANGFIDWRNARLDTIDTHIKEAKDADGLVGVAHPYRIGSPMCKGCHWEYTIQKWEQVDYIEVWNKVNPYGHFWSEKAYQLWTKVLGQGYRVSCSAGRDWHNLEGDKMTPGVTYIQTKESFTPETFKEALKNGSTYITLGPRINVEVVGEEGSYTLGETVPSGQYRLNAKVLAPDISSLTEREFEPTKLQVIQNEKIIQECTVEKGIEDIEIHCAPGYLRLEVLGNYKKLKDTRLLLTNPIYFI